MRTAFQTRKCCSVSTAVNNTSKNLRFKKIQSIFLEENDTTFERSVSVEWKDQNPK